MQKKDVEAVAGIALLYAAMMALGVTCPIKFLTGVSCAGCGMSRAWLCLLRGDAAGAFTFHPLFWLPPLAAAGYLCRGKMPKAAFRGGVVLVCALFLGVYVLRLLSPEDAVVVWEPARGFLFQLLSRVLGR